MGYMKRQRKPGRERRLAVRRSPIHGRGVFAVRPISAGARIIEYRGEHIDDEEVLVRYPETMDGENHTFIFEVGPDLNIDGGRKGNSSRWINHSCEPNCEAIEEQGRIHIEALRRIRAGEELTYDYNIDAGERITPAVKRRWPCRCGGSKCRGTVLVPTEKN
jgi:SET domain-containing protein